MRIFFQIFMRWGQIHPYKQILTAWNILNSKQEKVEINKLIVQLRRFWYVKTKENQQGRTSENKVKQLF